MLKTDIVALEVSENFGSFEILLPVGEAVLRIALRRRFPKTLIGQVPAMYYTVVLPPHQDFIDKPIYSRDERAKLYRNFFSSCVNVAVYASSFFESGDAST